MEWKGPALERATGELGIFMKYFDFEMRLMKGDGNGT